jgi:hypothetical protein
MKKPIKHKNLTKFEKELLKLLEDTTFYSTHGKFCDKEWLHDYNLKCTCSQGKAQIRANIVLNQYGMGFVQFEVDKDWPEDEMDW